MLTIGFVKQLTFAHKIQIENYPTQDIHVLKRFSNNDKYEYMQADIHLIYTLKIVTLDFLLL